MLGPFISALHRPGFLQADRARSCQVVLLFALFLIPSSGFAVGTISQLVLTASPPNPATAGVQFNLTVVAEDQSNNQITTDNDPITFSNVSDPLAVLPGSPSMSGGSANLTFTFKTSGSQSFVMTNDGISLTVFVNVAAAAPTVYFVSAPSAAVAGVAFTVDLIAEDQFGNLSSGYNAVVNSISCQGCQGTVQTSAAVTSGQGNFQVTINSAGNWVIAVSDGAISGTSGAITVTPLAASQFGISVPPHVSAAAQFNITVTALDQFNNTVPGYTGTVHFTSSDAAGLLPADTTLPNGVGIFNVTLNTPGAQSITATDTATSTITGSVNVTVRTACSAASQTFSNPAVLEIPAGAPAVTMGPASIFPSTITVPGNAFAAGQTVGSVSVTLYGLSHTFPNDIVALLVGPGDQNMILMASTGGGNPGVSNATITFDDTASGLLPTTGSFASGIFRPTDNEVNDQGADPALPSPAPVPPYNDPKPTGTASLASVFGGASPAGDWSLYVYDQSLGDSGQLAGGWSLTITPQQTFSSSTPIQFNSGLPNPPTTTNPYPSTISVSGLPGNITKVRLSLNGLTDKCPKDLAILLVGPQHQAMVPLSRVGGCTLSTLTVGTLVLDDAAFAHLPQFAGNNTALTAGAYSPSSYLKTQTGVTPSFLPPAPVGQNPLATPDGAATFASVFNGTNPNGTWSLYIQQQSGSASADVGQFASGWSLSFQTDCPADSQSVLTTDVNPSVTNQPVTCTATVTSSQGTPTGSVQFMDGASVLSTQTLNNGSAQFITNDLSVSTHSLSAVYLGNTSWASASGSLPQTVQPAATLIALGSSQNPGSFSSPVTFTATISGVFGNAPVAPSGTVTFKDSGTTLGTGALSNGTAVSPPVLLSLGLHSITAVYGGDANFQTGTSPALTELINPGNTQVLLTGSFDTAINSMMFFRRHEVLTATVTVPGGEGNPTGTVKFEEGANVLATVPVNAATGTATYSPDATLPLGTHVITAHYSGDSNFASASSFPLVLVRGPKPHPRP